MKFIADAMLGRLAKWLRLFGYDVLYYPEIDDRLLIRIARAQERTILTRDTRLLKTRGLPESIYIGADHVFQQLAEIKDRVQFSENILPARCILCNEILSRVPDKSAIQDHVPDFVFHSFQDFLKCGDCGKVYWEGTHRKKAREKIAEILSGSTAPRDREERH